MRGAGGASGGSSGKLPDPSRRCASPRKGVGEGQAWGSTASNQIRAPGAVTDSCPGPVGGAKGSLTWSRGPGQS